MAQRDMVTRTEAERADLLPRPTNGKVSARQLPRAHILLQADAGRLDTLRATARQVGMATVARVRKRGVEEGLEAALRERPRPGGPRRLDGHQAACLRALAGSTPPAGRPSWTMP